MQFAFPDRVVWVTGSSRGIGYAIAAAFAHAGAAVVLNGRDPNKLATAEQALREAGYQVFALTGDVRDPQQVEDMVRHILERYGRLDVLVNNAGGNFAAPLESISVKGWHTLIDLNLTSVFLCAKASFPAFVRQGGGVIINISSVAAFEAHPLRAPYGAAKAGVIALTKSMAYEWAKWNIRVHCVAPGAILTEASPWTDPGRQQEAAARVALQRVGSPDEIAGICLFLASEGASYMTGETIRVDGGPHPAV